LYFGCQAKFFVWQTFYMGFDMEGFERERFEREGFERRV
jgi:hypothetical protein